MAANCSAPIMPTVSGVTVACIDTTSASATSLSSESCVASAEYGSKAMTRIPSASSRQRTARPTAPRPTSPAVLPAICQARNRW
jgi:hypothetical protein